MERIKELIVVEGKHDVARINQLFDCDTIITGGLSLNDETIELIRQAQKARGVIILTDPDQPGEVIRKRIMEKVPEARCAFVRKSESIGKRNVGIEYASDEAIREALDNLITFSNRSETISWNEFLDLDIIGDKDKRTRLCESIHIGYCNNKTLFKRLNLLGLSYNDVEKLMNG